MLVLYVSMHNGNRHTGSRTRPWPATYPASSLNTASMHVREIKWNRMARAPWPTVNKKENP